VLVVTNPEVSAVRDADRIIGIVEAEEKGPAQLVINRIDPAKVQRGDMISTEDIVELLAIHLVGIIPEDDNVIVSTNRGTPIALDGKSRAGEALRNIAGRLLGEDIPFMDLSHQGSFFNQLGRLFSGGGSKNV